MEIEEEIQPTQWGILKPLNITRYKTVYLNKDIISIGRLPVNNHQLNDIRLSGVHCEISIKNNVVTLLDKSSNGTYLFDEKIGKGQSRKLEHGNIIFLLHEGPKVPKDDILGYVFEQSAPQIDPKAQKLEEERLQAQKIEQDRIKQQEIEQQEKLKKEQEQLQIEKKKILIMQERQKKQQEQQQEKEKQQALETELEIQKIKEQAEKNLEEEKQKMKKQKEDQEKQKQENDKQMEEFKKKLEEEMREKMKKELEDKEQAHKKEIEQSLLKSKANETEFDMSEEFECCICMEIIYKCVSLTPCLHNMCGACASDWLQKKDICPTCNAKVERVRKNPTLNNLISKYINKHPDKKWQQEIIDAMDKKDKITKVELTIAELNENMPQQNLQKPVFQAPQLQQNQQDDNVFFNNNLNNIIQQKPPIIQKKIQKNKDDVIIVGKKAINTRQKRQSARLKANNAINVNSDLSASEDELIIKPQQNLLQNQLNNNINVFAQRQQQQIQQIQPVFGMNNQDRGAMQQMQQLQQQAQLFGGAANNRLPQVINNNNPFNNNINAGKGLFMQNMPAFQANNRCQSCKEIFNGPIQPNQCKICNIFYCNLIKFCKGKSQVKKLTRVNQFKAPFVIHEDLFKGNQTEVDVLNKYLKDNKIQPDHIFKEILENQIKKGSFIFIKSFFENQQLMQPVNIQENDPFCGACMQELWFQIVFRFRIQIKEKLEFPNNYTELCPYALNCRTIKHDKDHERNFDHVGEQTKF